MTRHGRHPDSPENCMHVGGPPVPVGPPWSDAPLPPLKIGAPPGWPDEWPPIQAFYSTYPGLKGRVRLLHVKRPAGVAYRKSTYVRGTPHEQGWCGTQSWVTPKTGVVILDELPLEPPHGLQWCATCVGRLAEWLGVLPLVARLVARVERRGRPAEDGEAEDGPEVGVPGHGDDEPAT